MKRKRWTVLAVFAMVVALLPLSAVPAAAASGLVESFDDSSGFTTSTPFFSDGGWDYFGITDGATGDFGGDDNPAGLKPYTGFDGHFLAGMDLDGEGATLPIVVDWTGIDISGVSALEFSGDFAEYFDSPGDIDAADYILVESQIDGGGYDNLIKFVGADFTSSSGPYNGVFREDTNFDGTGNGAALGDSAQTFVKSIAGTGSSLDLRMSVSLDSGDEDFAVDNFSIGEATPPSIADPVINEFVANHTSSDTEAFVEVFGDAATDYSAFTVLEIEGDGSGAGVIDAVLPIGTTSAGGYWTSPEDMENGTISVLLVEGFSGSKGSDLDTDNDGMLEAEPWSRVVDAVGVNDGGSGDHNYSNVVLVKGYDGLNFFTVGGASRIPNGTDTDTTADWMRNDFDGFGFPGFAGSPALGEAVNTPGAVNEAITVPTDPLDDCGDPATFIHDIQGSGAASTDVGSIREIEGIVTGDFEASNQLNGFFMQEEATDQDGDSATSEGIFVFNDGAGPGVAVGDVVRVRGTVSESYDLTELGSIAGIQVCTTGPVAAATTVNLPIADVSDWETVEGMLVTIPGPLYVSGNYNQGYVGEVDLSINGPLDNPTNVVTPGVEANDLQNLNDRSRIQLDDGSTWSNPPWLPYFYDDPHTLRTGDVTSGVTGAISYGFGAYELHPTDEVVFTAANSRPTSSPAVGGTLRVAAFNVLNYFTTLDDGNPICGPDANQDCRGADNAFEFGRQKAKIVSAITKMDADVVGLMEIENHPGDVPVADLVSGLNDVAGAGTYDYIATGAVGSDAIRQAIIYQPASVTPVGAFAVLESSVDPTFNDEKNRPAIAQTFMDNTTGDVVTVVVNHLKSKGSSCSSIGDPDTGDGQGNCNATRTAAAEALANWLATDPTDSGDPDFLITGDLNSYAMEDPIAAITGAGYTDLIGQNVGTGWISGKYSYNFDSQSGYLDHALASPSLALRVTGASFWHINADEPNGLNYNDYNQADLYQSDEFRASDHDPVIVGLDLKPITVVQLEVRVRSYADTGAITGNQTGRILIDRLKRARRYMEKGKTAAYKAQLQSFMNQVQGLAPKFIDQNAADVLSNQAWWLMNQ